MVLWVETKFGTWPVFLKARVGDEEWGISVFIAAQWGVDIWWRLKIAWNSVLSCIAQCLRDMVRVFLWFGSGACRFHGFNKFVRMYVYVPGAQSKYSPLGENTWKKWNCPLIVKFIPLGLFNFFNSLLKVSDFAAWQKSRVVYLNLYLE